MSNEPITIMAKAIEQGIDTSELVLTDPLTLRRIKSERLAKAALEALRAAGYWVEGPPRVRSRWPGWDRSRGPWSAALHQDSVCSAVFRDGYTAEDARTLLSFINRTWGPPPVQTEGGGG